MDLNKFYIAVRHGEIDRYPDSIIGSGTNIGLNEKGLIQSHQLAENISLQPNLSLIISSPLLRAAQTTEIISKKYSKPLPIYYEEAIQAQSFGVLENTRVSKARENESLKPFLYEFIPEKERYISTPTGGESLESLSIRATQYLKFLSKHILPSGLLIVTHQSVLRALHGTLKGIDPSLWDKTVSIDHGECFAIAPDLSRIFKGTLNNNNFEEI